MLREFKVERVINSLENNLANFDEVYEQSNPVYQEAWSFFHQNFSELISPMNEFSYSMEYRHFEQSKIISLDEFDQQFYETYNFWPMSPAFAFPKNIWEEVKKSTKISDWTSGCYFPGRFFSKHKKSKTVDYLQELGIIFILSLNDTPKDRMVLEHELLHSSFEKYSKNLPRLIEWHYHPDLEQFQLQHIMEARLLNEILAYQHEIKENPSNLAFHLVNRYLIKELDYVKTSFKKDKGLVRRLSMQMSDRLINDMPHFKKFFQRFPSYMASPICLGVGPRLFDITNLHTSSSFDDIILWSKMAKKGKYFRKAKKILKEKGYSLD